VPSKSPQQRSLHASGAALRRWSGEDPKPAMAKVRAGRWTKLERRVDPQGELSPEERQRRAQALMRSEMKFLALKSAKARAKRAAT
jgi:hypothetical protein